MPIVEIEQASMWKSFISENEFGSQLFSLLKFIDGDEFWKAQIAHLNVEKDGEITMIPQVTKQKILFGTPEDLAEKFKKLKIFYTKVLPNKGWNTYSVVNVKFKNQIVCE